MKFENLQVVNYYNGEYLLEFNINGKLKYITVDASDHPMAAIDEDYFDNNEVVEMIIADIITNELIRLISIITNELITNELIRLISIGGF